MEMKKDSRLGFSKGGGQDGHRNEEGSVRDWDYNSYKDEQPTPGLGSGDRDGIKVVDARRGIDGVCNTHDREMDKPGRGGHADEKLDTSKEQKRSSREEEDEY